MGFDKDFIQGFEIPLPILGERIKQFAFDNGNLIDHTRFSIMFNIDRGFAIYTAHNIDGNSIIPLGEIKRKNNFRLDKSVPSDIQVNDKRGYYKNPWDRGHLVRRRSLHWGNKDEASLADSESFYWTNIAPQHENLHDTAWGSIEDWMLGFSDENDKKVSIFTGPVFTPDDPEHQNLPGLNPIKIPAGFWKILIIKIQESIRAAGFLVWQRDFDKPDPVTFDPLLEQVRITTIEYLVGLSFGPLRDADPLRFGVQFSTFAGRSTPLPFTSRHRSSVILSPQDIVI